MDQREQFYDLVTFLGRRLDEDERAARDAVADGAARWQVSEDPRAPFDVVDGNGVRVARGEERPSAGQVAHIARHDPARVLAEIHVKRQLLQMSNASCPTGCRTEHLFSGSCSLRRMGPVREEDGQRWIHDDTGARFRAPSVTPEWALRALAVPYFQHPDYRSAWAAGAS